MLQSIKNNGGFYIGKYETGTTTPRGNHEDPLTTAVIKQNAYPYGYVIIGQAELKSKELKTGNRTSSLLYGIQWYLVIKQLKLKNLLEKILFNKKETL